MLQALLNMLLGMGSVFLVLIIICLIIYGFNIFPYIEKKQKAKNKTEEMVQIQRPVQLLPPDPKPEEDMQAIVAAITAAITAYTGMSSDGFVVKSIKRRK